MILLFFAIQKIVVPIGLNVVKWQSWCRHGGMPRWIFGQHRRKFVKEWLPWQRHRPQWRVYMADFWPSVIRR